MLRLPLLARRTSRPQKFGAAGRNAWAPQGGAGVECHIVSLHWPHEEEARRPGATMALMPAPTLVGTGPWTWTMRGAITQSFPGSLPPENPWRTACLAPWATDVPRMWGGPSSYSHVEKRGDLVFLSTWSHERGLPPLQVRQLPLSTYPPRYTRCKIIIYIHIQLATNIL